MALFSDELIDKVARYGRDVFLLTGRRAMLDAGYLEKMYSFLRHNGFKVSVFDMIPPEPEDDIISLGAERFKENGCDVILAMGGGSVIDAAKCISILAANGGVIYDYKNAGSFDSTPYPVVAVPTTCGSGSEVTRYAVVVNREPKEKFTIKSTDIIPGDYILDDEVLKFLPDGELVASSFDSSAHMIEVILFNMSAGEESVEASFSGLDSVFSNLDGALNKRNVASFRALMDGANTGGRVINAERTGLPHTLGNKLTAHVKLKHGMVNALIIPEALRYLEQRSACDPVFEERLERFKEFLMSKGLFKGSVHASLRDYYSGLAPLASQGGNGLHFDDGVRKEIIRQTCNDRGLFDITPGTLEVEDISRILEAVIEGLAA